MSKTFTSPQQAHDWAIMQSRNLGKQMADKADGLNNHPWGRESLRNLYSLHPACLAAALDAYEARLMDLSGEASA